MCSRKEVLILYVVLGFLSGSNAANYGYTLR